MAARGQQIWYNPLEVKHKIKSFFSNRRVHGIKLEACFLKRYHMSGEARPKVFVKPALLFLLSLKLPDIL